MRTTFCSKFGELLLCLANGLQRCDISALEIPTISRGVAPSYGVFVTFGLVLESGDGQLAVAFAEVPSAFDIYINGESIWGDQQRQ